MPKNKPIENTHIRFCKELLGVQKQITNIRVLLELGRVPIMFHGIKNSIKNWSGIHITGNGNEIVLLIHTFSLEDSLLWTQEAKDCLNRPAIGGETKRESLYKTTF